MNAPSVVSMSVMPAAKMIGKETTAKKGRPWEAAPAEMASSATSEAVPKPRPIEAKSLVSLKWPGPGTERYGTMPRKCPRGGFRVKAELIFAGLGGLPQQTVTASYKARCLDLTQDRRFKYINIFRNHGRVAGASLEHPHSQLIALPMVPQNVLLRAHYPRDPRCSLPKHYAREQLAHALA